MEKNVVEKINSIQLHKLIIVVFLISHSACFISCVTDLNYDDQTSSIPVVNCILTNDTIQKLSLTRSVKINDSYIFREIKDAEITLLQNDSVVGNFIRIGYDNWKLKFRPKAGIKYQLNVVLSSGKVISASTTMPNKLRILPQNNIDKYPSKNYIQYTSGSPCWVTIISTDSLLLPLSRPRIKDIARDEIGTNHPFADRFNQYGNLLESLPSADTPKFNFYIRIKSDQLSDSIPFKLQTRYGLHTFICFRTASVEYDKYLKTSLQKILMRLDETDPGTWFDENKVYSNIINGTGIFAAYCDQFYNYNDDDSYFGN